MTRGKDNKSVFKSDSQFICKNMRWKWRLNE